MHSNGLSADLEHIVVMENQRKQLQQAEDQLLAAALSSALTLTPDNLYQMFALAFGLQLEKDRQQKALSEAEGIGGQVLAGGLHLSTSQHDPQGGHATPAHTPKGLSADPPAAAHSTYLPGNMLSHLLLCAGGDKEHLVVLLSAYAAAAVMVSQSGPQQQRDMVLRMALEAAQQQLEDVLLAAGDVSMLSTCQRTVAALNLEAGAAGHVGITDACLVGTDGFEAAGACPALQLQPAAAECPGW